MKNFEQTSWWQYMDEPMRDLMKTCFLLLEREETLRQAQGANLHDYSFVVFPASKAYEGFLKKLLFNLGFITKQQYFGDRFRIGKALNPHLPKRYQWGWVYGNLMEHYQGEQLPLQMWETWKRARNQIFHFFPDHHEFVNLAAARQLIEQIVETMDKSLKMGHNTPYPL